jgi:hypothetical protein
VVGWDGLSWTAAANRPIVHCPMIYGWIWSSGGMILTGVIWRTLRKTCHEWYFGGLSRINWIKKNFSYFQQDNTWTHTAENSVNNHKGLWPSDSLDPNMYNVYLWVNLKQKVYKNNNSLWRIYRLKCRMLFQTLQKLHFNMSQNLCQCKMCLKMEHTLSAAIPTIS